MALRILCLHDKGSSAPELKDVLKLLGDRLYDNHSIDLVYVNSPFITPASTSNNRNNHHEDEDDDVLDTTDKEDGTKNTQRTWWWHNDEINHKPEQMDASGQHDATSELDTSCERIGLSDKENNNNEEIQSTTTSSNRHRIIQNKDGLTQYRGLDASLMLLRQIWNSCPFWGIIGVGQGAAVAALLILTILYPETPLDEDSCVELSEEQHPPLLPPPQFAIFMQGQTLLPNPELLIDNNKIPILHLILDTDQNNTTTTMFDRHPSHTTEEIVSHQRFIQQFGGTVHVLRSERNKNNRNNDNNISVKALNVMGRFIISQKMNLIQMNRSSSSSSKRKEKESNHSYSNLEIVSLQTALIQVELEATDVITKHIMSNPPAALMAVIRPQAVAGWDGNLKPRRPIGSGGAPCPIEFLHRKQAKES
jgi:Serine hydrolase (FSH1)